MKRILGWVGAGCISVILTLLVYFPAPWAAYMVGRATSGRLTLGDAQGSLWSGSAFIGIAPSSRDPVTLLFSGRFHWRLSPVIFFGRINLDLENQEALSKPLYITGSWSAWQSSGGSILFESGQLAGLGAPLNTIAPEGKIQLDWQNLRLDMQNRQLYIHGSMALHLQDMASRLSALRPLGSYVVDLNWNGQMANLSLRSKRGPLLLSGIGRLGQGELQFSGRAEAAIGKEDALDSLLGLLGQFRSDGKKNYVALEFR